MRLWLIVAVALGGCFAPTGSCAEPAQITWWHAMGGQNGEVLASLVADFNASQQDYEIQPVYKGNYTETMTSAIAAYRAGHQPHIVQVYEIGTATMIAASRKGAVYPVAELMKDAGVELDHTKFLPAVSAYYSTEQGQLLSLPFNSSTAVLWYNRTQLDALGVDVPETWDELLHVAAVAKQAGIEAPFSMAWQGWTNVENFSAWHNLPVATMNNGFGGLATELTVNNPALVGHLARIASMGREGLFRYGGRRGGSRSMFVSGETILWIGTSAYYGGLKESITDFEFGQAMLPLDTEVATAPQNSTIGGASLWVLRGHTQPEYQGVARFFEWLSEPEQQMSWHQQTGYVPITMAAYERSKAAGYYRDHPGTDTAIRQLSLNSPTAASRGLRLGNFSQIRDVINEEMEAIWSGEKDAQGAMDDAVRRGNRLLRRFERTNR